MVSYWKEEYKESAAFLSLKSPSFYSPQVP